MTAEHVLVHVTTDSEESAHGLADSAVRARLAACAQIEGPITSVFWWEGEVQRSEEWRVSCKTTAARYPALESHLLDHHPYDTPEIIATPVTGGSAAYLAWVTEEVSSS
ncbi:divalent-cation tolerance protein CutA [Streptomyces xiamenensis]|uniref:divalent-cation tolerance protein CutA n=1 Tax=Streptomyces sp. XC 2026 TaxID=2782004 RepID=UPI001906C8C4|nr:divalent-cation tolerance protein CutA [Streptomyces sp. XC 2026]QQN79544.1 divalent-cation tolerance protein CutA [Streptomyces sp. XC 2026]